MDIRFTAHVLDRADERGIGLDEMRLAVQRGRRHRLGDRMVASYLYFKVVFRIEGKTAIVITVFAPR